MYAMTDHALARMIERRISAAAVSRTLAFGWCFNSRRREIFVSPHSRMAVVVDRAEQMVITCYKITPSALRRLLRRHPRDGKLYHRRTERTRLRALPVEEYAL